MFLINFFRWLVSYVKIKAQGGFGERFINLCTLEGIDLRDTKLGDEYISATINAKDYRRIKSVAKKSGMKISVVKKGGLYFFINKNKNRYGLLIGAVIFFVFIYISSLFIWSVDVIGCENVSKELIAQTISQIGLDEGTPKWKINTEDMTNQAMILLNSKVSWLAINIKGTHAIIEVRDFVPKREDVTYKEPCNIVADFDGLIMTLEVYNGHKANFEGSGVKKGDLLISGIFENRNTSSQFMEARGKITALHNVTAICETDKKLKCRKFTSSKKRYKLSLFSIKIPLGFFSSQNAPFEVYSQKNQLCYGDTKLPFAIICETRAYYKNGTLNDENSVLRAYTDFTNENYSKFKNTLITSAEVHLSDENTKIVIESQNECIDFMGVKEKIF